jgi:hypothetical protein
MDEVSSLILGKQKPKYSVRDVQNMVFGQESSFGKADTSKANYAGATGPMQITMPTFEGLKKKGLIPKDYDINNTQHNKEAGNALIADAYNRYEGDADKVLAEYYGGPKAISKTGQISTEMRDLKNSKAPTVGQYIEQAKSKFQPLDDVSNLILGGEEQIQEEKPKGFIAELKKPLQEMSIEGFKKESLLAPAIKYTAASLGLPGFTEEDKKVAQENLVEKGKGALKSVEQFIKHPIETAKAIGSEVVEHPGRVIGETIKGAIYDPELAVIPGGAVTKPLEKGIAKAGVVARELGEQFAKKEPAMAGVGAAEVGAIKNRVERAKELPIPIELSKDQATRNPADVRFARETAKDPVLGQALQEKYATDNAKIQQNLDKFIENTGAELTGAGEAEIGKVLADTVSKAKTARKAQIEPAYTAAREAGQMSELLDTKPMQSFINDNLSASKNAPIISSINSEIKRLSKDGKISINDLEEVRKMAGVLSQSSGPDAYYGRKAIKLIDQMTQGKGGDLYKEARRINTEYMKEFENTPVIRDITAMKPGTTERSVRIENLVDKSLISSPGENVKQLFASLERMGPEGQTITKELRGAVAQRIKDEATKGVQLDINGKPYVSTKNLDTIIKKLDKSGKLEFIFGKKGAEHYRTLNEVTKDLQTVPQGTTNPSGTAATILGALTEMGIQGATTGLPVPVATIGKVLYNKRQTGKKLTKINEFINYSKEK